MRDTLAYYARMAGHGALTAIDRLRPRGELRQPPASAFIGSGDYERIAAGFLDHFKDTGMRPDHRVLDIGCGQGRIAIAVAGYLDGGSYEGFDIIPYQVRWARRHITSRHPNMRFQVADVYSRMYHRGGRTMADDYRFPYSDGEFDFAWATSLFTHLLPAGAANYLAETARVLKPGGAGLLTFYLTDGHPDFPHRHGEGWVADPNVPEAVVAFPEAWLRDQAAACGLTVDVRYGRWAGRGGDRPATRMSSSFIAQRAGMQPGRADPPTVRALRRHGRSRSIDRSPTT